MSPETTDQGLGLEERGCVSLERKGHWSRDVYSGPFTTRSVLVRRDFPVSTHPPTENGEG